MKSARVWVMRRKGGEGEGGEMEGIKYFDSAVNG